jgi:single-stranded-DNA-specific exonuclease
MQKRWKILQAAEDKITSLHEALKVNRTLCKILVQRGIDDFEKARQFFRPQLADLHDPWLMKDMDKAVEPYINCIQSTGKNSCLWRL